MPSSDEKHNKRTSVNQKIQKIAEDQDEKRLDIIC